MNQTKPTCLNEPSGAYDAVLPGEPSEHARPRRRRRRRVAIAGFILLVLLLLANAVLLQVAAEAIVRSPNAGKVPRPTSERQIAESGVDHVLRVDVGPPAAVLCAWIIEPDTAVAAVPAGTVLVAHGIHSKKQDMVATGRLLAQEGFRAVLVDLRGHGESTGDRLSFGANESRDLSQVIDQLERTGWLAGDLGAYGPSFGGATVIQLAARDPRVKAVVAVCPFSSMREIVPIYVRRYLPAGERLPEFWIQLAIDAAGRSAEFDPDEASPKQAAGRTTAPILLIHGRADAHIPFSHSETIAAAAPGRSRLVIVDGEDHGSIMQDRTGTIRREALAWFHQHLGRRGGISNDDRPMSK